MKKLLLALALLPSLAYAQTNIPNHTVPIGRGPGVIGFASAGPCTTNQVLAWASGTSADPTCGSVINLIPLGTSGYALIANGASAATFQGWLNTASGAVTRTWQDKVSDWQGILDFGADNTGVANSATAWTNAFATSRATKITAGTYTFTTQPTLTAKPLIFEGQPSFTGSFDPRGASVATTTTALAANGQANVTVATTTGMFIGMRVTSPFYTGWGDSNSQCIPNATTIQSINSLVITLTANINCAAGLPSGSILTAELSVPHFRFDPNTFTIGDLDTPSDYSSFVGNGPSGYRAFTLQTSHSYNSNQAYINSMLVRSFYRGNASLTYAQGTSNVPFGNVGGLQDVSFSVNKFGDGAVQNLALGVTLSGSAAQGYQGALNLTTDAECQNSASQTIFCNLRNQENVTGDNGTPSAIFPIVARGSRTSSMVGLPGASLLVASNVTGGGAPMNAGLEIDGFQASASAANQYNYGLDFGLPIINSASRFATGFWARIPAGTFLAANNINSTTAVIGGIERILPVTNSSGIGCTGGPGWVNLAFTGGGGAGATAKAFLTTNGALGIVAVTAPGTGYTSAPTVNALAGCATQPTFTVYMSNAKKTFGTDANGVTQIWGADYNASGVMTGTIEFRNANTANPMAKYVGSTGGGMQIYNGASAPTGGDLGAGTIDAAGQINSDVGYKGRPSSTPPTAGNIGEQVSTSVGSGSAIAITTTATIQAASISLTAGIWQVCGNAAFISVGAVTITHMAGAVLSGTSMPSVNSAAQYASDISTLLSGGKLSVSTGCQNIALSGTTTINLNMTATFSGGTSLSGYGTITAQRAG